MPTKGYSVCMPFTSVPVVPAFNIIKEPLEQNTTFQDRTVLSVQNIIELLGFCCIIPISHFKMNSMNRLKVWLWVLQLVP